MRTKILASAALMGVAAFCSPAFADDSALGPNDEVVPVVAPGDQIGVACGPLQIAQQDSDVRVVLTVSAMPGDTNPGIAETVENDVRAVLGESGGDAQADAAGRTGDDGDFSFQQHWGNSSGS